MFRRKTKDKKVSTSSRSTAWSNLNIYPAAAPLFPPLLQVSPQIWFSQPYSTSWQWNQPSEYKVHRFWFQKIYDETQNRDGPKNENQWLSLKKRYLWWHQMGVDTQNGLKSGLLYGGEGGEGEIRENKTLLLMRPSLKQQFSRDG